MDCFVAIAPRNDDEEAASLPFEAGSLLAPVVIASGAKQSISPLAEAWIASSLSLLAMTMRKGRRFHLGQGRRPAPIVIASGAKQSISPLAEAWIASSLSLLAMTMRKQRRFHLRQGRCWPPSSLRAERSNPYRRLLKHGLLRRYRSSQ